MTPLFTRARIGNLLVMLLLLAIAAGLLRLHMGESWWSAPPLPARWQWAALSSALYAAFCAWLWWRNRPAPAPAPAATADVSPVLITWASQTGFADELAQRTAQALRQSGHSVRLRPLHQVDASLLATTSQLLVIASTTGEGDPPDHATGFLPSMSQASPALAHLRYGVLALGDRSYIHFCQYGHQLDQWLRSRGALPLFDLVEVDNADGAALRQWQQLLGQLGGTANLQADWAAPEYQPWTLQQRHCINPGSAGHPVYELRLTPSTAVLPPWQAGDIAEVGPENAPAQVQAWLERHGVDGNELVDGAPLHEHLARRQLPDAPDFAAPHALLASLPALPHREYSVASVPAEGHLRLLLRRQLREDGTPGIGSGWLCDHVPVGGTVALRLRSNRNFHSPSGDAPLILIGNGTGIAGLRAHLRARIDAGHRRNWLLFGERNAAHDFHFGEELRQWHSEGGIERVDTVFSRDGGSHRYVQDVLAANADTLRAWIADGATVLVCGSLQGMAPAVDDVITRTIGAEQRDTLIATGRYRRDVY